MRRSLLVVLVIAVPLLLGANVVQAFRYNRLDRQIVRMEQEQQTLLEENKRIILAIAVLSSPDRIGEIASGELDLSRIDPEEITTLKVPGSEGQR